MFEHQEPLAVPTAPAPVEAVEDHIEEPRPEVVEPANEASRRHVEAGRKGAKRVHQLIEAGRLYEKEHGLKRGRQRLRQLIELGKRYEEEHGLARRPERRGDRLSRAERDELLSTLLQCLVRIAKPSFRAELTRLAEALEPTQPREAA